MVFVLPPKSAVGVLSAEIAGEGEKIIMSNGEQVNWTPPPARPVVPDFSGIKSIARYFGRSGYTPWPAWLYHDKEEPRLVKNADEAAELGVCYRETTEDERNRYGKTAMWDWTDESKWRPTPYKGTLKFDAKKNHQGKNIIIGDADPRIGQNELVRALVPEVVAAVIQAMKPVAPGAPANIDPKQWEAFQAFVAWQKTTEGVEIIEEALDVAKPNVLATGMTPDQDKSLWLEEAEARGIKVDKRWGVDRIRQEIEKAA